MVAVDVQHLYRASHPGDRGSIYTTSSGGRVAEAELATRYACGIVAALRERGADVLTNNPASGTLVGDYWTRNREAAAWGASIYLACHVNSGRGSYALCEAMSVTPGCALGQWLVNVLARDFPVILSGRVNQLHGHDRGAVCIEAFLARGAAVILEPFFGDNPSMQSLFGPVALYALGHTIGDAVADWHEATRQVA